MLVCVVSTADRVRLCSTLVGETDMRQSFLLRLADEQHQPLVVQNLDATFHSSLLLLVDLRTIGFLDHVMFTITFGIKSALFNSLVTTHFCTILREFHIPLRLLGVTYWCDQKVCFYRAKILEKTDFEKPIEL